jgi:hypothetical protein
LAHEYRRFFLFFWCLLQFLSSAFSNFHCRTL